MLIARVVRKGSPDWRLGSQAGWFTLHRAIMIVRVHFRDSNVWNRLFEDISII